MEEDGGSLIRPELIKEDDGYLTLPERIKDYLDILTDVYKITLRCVVANGQFRMGLPVCGCAYGTEVVK